MRAEVSAAFYNQRSVFTSAFFWRRIAKCCAKCHERYRLVEVEPYDRVAGIAPGVLVLDFTLRRTDANRIRIPPDLAHDPTATSA